MNSFLKLSVVAISMALAGTAAQAAVSHHHTKAMHVAHTRATHLARTRVAYRRYDRLRLPPSIADLIDGMLAEARAYGYAVPAHINLANAHWSVSSGGGDSSDWSSPPSDDTSAATDAENAAQASVDESNAIQQANDEAALNASMAAAEEQNDEANAATMQTEINANNGN
jgi:hypothetical protein